jgi:LysM domain/Prealbumin-like fold domain
VPVPVRKWEEKLDATVVPGEDWAITATPQGDPYAKVVTATITGGQGLLTLTPGKWSIAETVKQGWVPVTPPTVQLVLDQYGVYDPKAPPIVFKNREPKCYPKITVRKVGYAASGENLGMIAGVKFTVARADKTWPGTTLATQGDGRAVFDKLWPGVYKVTETVPKGWEIIGDNPVTVVLMDCEEVEATFENRELVGQLRITGKKLFKAWEKPYKGTLVGIPGWTITATLVGTDTSVTTTTDALGQYEFTMDTLKNAGMGFPGASIKVCEEKRDHWINVTADCATFKFPYPVPADYTGAVINFTNVQDPPVASAAAVSAPVASAADGCSAYHTVVRGDTLAKIAGRYGASASSIIRANNIRNADVIYAGQQLCIR